MPRFYCPISLASDAVLVLPPGTARHVQVLRLQPADALTLFDGTGGEYAAAVLRMGRSEVTVQVGAHDPVEREAPRAVHLALGMPANERMDWLVEKATELGVASIQPLVTAHSVLRLAGERADRKVAHWQLVAVAACEQCGRNRIPVVHPVAPLASWLASLGDGGAAAGTRLMLGFAPDARTLPVFTSARPAAAALTVLSGPEGGLGASEEESARARGFAVATLGPRVLRAETAPLAALALLASE